MGMYTRLGTQSKKLWFHPKGSTFAKKVILEEDQLLCLPNTQALTNVFILDKWSYCGNEFGGKKKRMNHKGAEVTQYETALEDGPMRRCTNTLWRLVFLDHPRLYSQCYPFQNSQASTKLSLLSTSRLWQIINPVQNATDNSACQGRTKYTKGLSKVGGNKNNYLQKWQ